METSNKTEKRNQGNISRQRYLWVIATFTLVGVIGGYAYYALIGCNLEGGCAIKSNPYLMMIWGGLMGYLIPDMFLKPRSEEQNQQQQFSSQE
jgi:predicted MFS family arabinose efflux permease